MMLVLKGICPKSTLRSSGHSQFCDWLKPVKWGANDRKLGIAQVTFLKSVIQWSEDKLESVSEQKTLLSSPPYLDDTTWIFSGSFLWIIYMWRLRKPFINVSQGVCSCRSFFKIFFYYISLKGMYFLMQLLFNITGYVASQSKHADKKVCLPKYWCIAEHAGALGSVTCLAPPGVTDQFWTSLPKVLVWKYNPCTINKGFLISLANVSAVSDLVKGNLVGMLAGATKKQVKRLWLIRNSSTFFKVLYPGGPFNGWFM